MVAIRRDSPAPSTERPSGCIVARCHASTLIVASFIALSGLLTHHEANAGSTKWAASWAAAAQGCYPFGAQPLQPDLRKVFRFQGAFDQTFRLIIRPDLWGNAIRLRFSNAFGDRDVSFDNVFVGLQASGAALVPETNQAVKFLAGQSLLNLAPGQSAYSDPIELPFVSDPMNPDLVGRKLAISFH